MPSPDTLLSTLRPDLAGSMMEFDLAADRLGFISHRVLPVFDTALQASTLGVIPIEQLLQYRDTTRAPGSGYARGQFTFTQDSYACFEHGAEEVIDDRQAKMYAHYFDAEQVATQRATDAVMRNAEARAAALLFNATTFSAQKTTITHEWDDKTNAVPIDDIETASRAIWARTGLWPNALIINRTVFRNLRQCAQIIDAIQSGGAGSATKATDITASMLKEVFDIDHIFVAGSAYSSAKEGQSTSIAPQWADEYAMVCRIATNANDPNEPCIGRTFHWTEDGSSVGGTIETYRDEKVRGNVVRVRHDVDEKLIHAEAAQLLDNITTT